MEDLRRKLQSTLSSLVVHKNELFHQKQQQQQQLNVKSYIMSDHRPSASVLKQAQDVLDVADDVITLLLKVAEHCSKMQGDKSSISVTVSSATASSEHNSFSLLFMIAITCCYIGVIWLV